MDQVTCLLIVIMVTFTYIHKIYKKIVMAFTTNNLIVNKLEVEKSTSLNIDKDNLTVEEIQLILITLRNSTFKGEYIELFYNTVVKLQNQYNNQQK